MLVVNGAMIAGGRADGVPRLGAPVGACEAGHELRQADGQARGADASAGR